MDPVVFEQYLKAARRHGVMAFEVDPGGALRVSLAPPAMAPARPRGLRETEESLADVDEDILYGSSGGDS